MVCRLSGRVAALVCTTVCAGLAFAAEPAGEGVRASFDPSHICIQSRAGVDLHGLLNASGGSAARLHDRTSLLAAFLKQAGGSVCEPTIDPPAADAASAAKLGLDRYFTVTIAPGTEVSALCAVLASEFGDVLQTAEPLGLVQLHAGPPNDPGYVNQWALNNAGQSIEGNAGISGADIQWLPAINAVGPLSQVIVAVLDTGVSTSHPDLIGQLVTGRNTTSTSQAANTDDSTSESHGTKCAGVIAAAGNNGFGVVGVAPNAKVMPVKVINPANPFPNNTYIANGLTWATDNGARIASMSFGTPDASVLRDAIAYARDHGVLLIASTGNVPGQPIVFPAAYADVVGVGATNNRDQLSTFTSTGPEMDIVAPGESIFTTVDQLNNPDGYGYESGTSFAAPMVAGVAAVVWGINPNLTAAQVRRILVGSAIDLGAAGYDSSFAAGRLNAYGAVREAIATLPNCPADFNGNRVSDTGDLFFFLDLYFSHFGESQGISQLDFNHDGLVDVGDLFGFLDAWFRVC